MGGESSAEKASFPRVKLIVYGVQEPPLILSQEVCIVWVEVCCQQLK